ncbi:MAG: pyridoxal phosphate-dependent aminotransferase [Acutalibacter sp.]|jgi:histidinol-phosphate aminotransferase
MYQLNEKIKDLKPYDPVEGGYRIHLDANESFLALPAPILEELAAAVPQVDFNRYPDPAARELCQAFAQYYGVPVENVAAGNGSDELITVLFTGFLQHGDAFATLEPDFSMYAFNGYLHEARHVPIPKREDYTLDVDETIRICQEEQVKLLIFSNPGNPTSLVCPKEEIRRLIRGVDALVVLDEAYMDFSDQSLLAEFEDYDNLLILRTCSKAFGMASLRLGFAVGRKPLVDAVKAVKSPYNVNSLSQKLGALVLEHPQAMKEALETILASKEELMQGLRALLEEFPGRFILLESATNFATMKLPDGERLFHHMGEQGIAIRYTGGLVRITCGAPEENRAVLQELADYFAAVPAVEE